MKHFFRISGLLMLFLLIHSCQKIDYNGQIGSVSDVDGNSYTTVVIRNQVWMTENLRTTKYNDGTEIPLVTDPTEWAALTTGAYGDYGDNPSYSFTSGKLYNWYVVDNNAATKVASNGGKNVCPTGWHVPSDAEWTILVNYLIANGYNWDASSAGNKIGKSLAATSGWTAYDTLGTVGNDQTSNNTSGFNAIPGGYRLNNGTYSNIGSYSGWWSSTAYSSSDAYGRGMYYISSSLGRNVINRRYGFSVRCIKN
jgi:uncharacterized protein (TIGR02145 family)